MRCARRLFIQAVARRLSDARVGCPGGAGRDGAARVERCRQGRARWSGARGALSAGPAGRSNEGVGAVRADFRVAHPCRRPSLARCLSATSSLRRVLVWDGCWSETLVWDVPARGAARSTSRAYLPTLPSLPASRVAQLPSSTGAPALRLGPGPTRHYSPGPRPDRTPRQRTPGASESHSRREAASRAPWRRGAGPGRVQCAGSSLGTAARPGQGGTRIGGGGPVRGVSRALCSSESSPKAWSRLSSRPAMSSSGYRAISSRPGFLVPRPGCRDSLLPSSHASSQARPTAGRRRPAPFPRAISSGPAVASRRDAGPRCARGDIGPVTRHRGRAAAPRHSMGRYSASRQGCRPAA